MNEQQKTALIQPQILANPELNDKQLLDLLYIKDIAVHINVQTRDIDLYLMSKGLWVAFKNDVSEDVVIAKDAIIAFSPTINTNENYALFVAIVQGLVDDIDFPFTTTHQSEVLAMADALESWADQNIPDLSEGDIARARV